VADGALLVTRIVAVPCAAVNVIVACAAGTESTSEAAAA